MLDSKRNLLISNAFRKANITSIESNPTEAEIEDAAHSLNSMLQSWNNDGFRLFKIKDGFLPFIPGVNEYSLAKQAYKSFSRIKIHSIDRIGATKLPVSTVSNASYGQKIIVVNNIRSEDDYIARVDYENIKIELQSPLSMPAAENDAVFYGNFNTALTEIKNYAGLFDTIPYSGEIISPVAGDVIYISYNGNWLQKTIASVDLSQKTITVAGASFAEGNITSSIIVFGPEVFLSQLTQEEPLQARMIHFTGDLGGATSISIPEKNGMGRIFEIESVNINGVIIKNGVDESVLEELGYDKIEADIIYPTQQEASWTDLSGIAVSDSLDWGSITDSSDLITDDWGYVIDDPETLLDWGTLTGSARIIGFSRTNDIKYLLAQDLESESIFLFYNSGSGWTAVDMEITDSSATLYTANGVSYYCGNFSGVYSLNGAVATSVFSGTGVEKIIKFKDVYYLVSPKQPDSIIRNVTATKDFALFESTYTISLDSIVNPVEFMEKMFIGTTDTFVGDMKNFTNIDVYSQNRCVIGDRLLNLNTSQYCSYTKDSINFYPMPLTLSNETAWGSKDGCSFIAVYGILFGGVVSTQIFTANDFNPVWTPQVVVPGRVFDIFFDDKNAYFVSDINVTSLQFRSSVTMVESITAFAFGEQIGRPQQIMNVMKYGFNGQVELPMNALSLQEFTLLPRMGLGGEPVNYCFLREAFDGKMMVWGTPTKFGEYLKFSYVEPLALLEDARSTPDFPDEYYEAVEDGLAAELAISYGAPLDRQQILTAKAEASKENALLHDNEDTSYNIMPNQRWS